MKHLHIVYRGLAPLMAAGLLLQAGGCTFDIDTIVAGLVTSIGTNLITSFIFGALNLAAF